MGVGHLDIGTGIGGAQVFNPLPAVQMYGQVLAQRKAKQDADNKYLADTLAKGYDPSGLRNDADRQAYVKQYSDIKQQAIDSENEKDPMKKALALAQVRQQLNDLGSWGEGSKKQGAFERQIAMQAFSNPHLLTNDAVQKLKNQMQMRYDADGVVRDSFGFERGVDPTKIDNEIKNHVATILKQSLVTYGPEMLGPESIIEGKKSRQATSNRVIPFDGPDGALENTLHFASANEDYQKYLHDTYPQIQGQDDATTRALQVKQDLIDRGYGEGFKDTPRTRTVTANEPPQWTLEQQWFLKHYGVPYNPNPPGQVVSNQPTPAQTLATSMQRGEPGSGEKLFNMLPVGQYGDKRPSVNIDEKTGLQEIQFPEQVVINKKAVAANEKLKSDAKKDNNPVDKDLLEPETITKAPAKKYQLDPNSNAYLASWAQMVKEQGGNLSQLNQIEGIKGGHGQVQQAQGQNTNYQNITTAKDPKGNIVTLGYKNGKWYNTKTNQSVE